MQIPRGENRIFFFMAAAGLFVILGTRIFDGPAWWQTWWPDAFLNIETHKNGTVIGLFLLIFAGAGVATYAVMRDRSPRAMANNDSISLDVVHDLPGIPVGELVIIRRGGISKEMNLPGKNGCYIVHCDSVFKVGSGIRIMTDVTEWRKDQLWPDVRDMVEMRGISPPYLVGNEPAFVEARTDGVSAEWRKARLRNTELTHAETAKLGTIQTLTRIANSAQVANPGMIQAVKDYRARRRAESDKDTDRRD